MNPPVCATTAVAIIIIAIIIAQTTIFAKDKNRPWWFLNRFFILSSLANRVVNEKQIGKDNHALKKKEIFYKK